MRFYFIFFLVVLVSCQEENSTVPSLTNNYGKGMYVVTDLGIHYFNYEDSAAVIQTQIFNSVNGINLINPKNINFIDGKGFILSDRLSIVDINTFGLENEITGFSNPVFCDKISFNRLLVADKGASTVRIVDLDLFDIVSNIETGDSTKPTFIMSTYTKAYILNGGRVPAMFKDSTMIAIEHKDQLVPTSIILDIVNLGDNPSSGMIQGDLLILCRGVFNPSNPLFNTESSIYKVFPNNLNVFYSRDLANIYNADNLVYNYYNNRYYFTADGGIYGMSENGTGITQIITSESDILVRNEEKYSNTDTTETYANMFYINDINNPSNIYKYNMSLSQFVDTIVVPGKVVDIKFKK
tara:strand:- start:16178 stop:17236 length:1059 start_codon:yes stop_codon:yes gene_type:complete